MLKELTIILNKAMKNSKVRTFFFLLLLIASTGSFLYINSVQVPESKINCQAKKDLVEEASESEADMPDVRIFKKLIEKGKEMLPNTRF